MRRRLLDAARASIGSSGSSRDQRDDIFEEGAEETVIACDEKVNLLSIEAEVVRCEGDLLVVEFDSPEDGFDLPGKGKEPKLLVLPPDSKPAPGLTLDERLSTRSGSHPGGVRLRLALRRADGSPWIGSPWQLIVLQFPGSAGRGTMVFIRRRAMRGRSA